MWIEEHENETYFVKKHQSTGEASDEGRDGDGGRCGDENRKALGLVCNLRMGVSMRKTERRE